jgi:aerotaxis receptor
MPEQAFADLWTTLQAGRPWTGLVKNRRKNGDHYWVLANATPLLENGATTGYLSVRTRPSREQVAAATAPTRLFTSGQADGLAIHEGHVVRTGGLARCWPHPGTHCTMPRCRVKATLLGLGMVGTAAAAAGAVHLASMPLAACRGNHLLITLTAGAAFVRRLGHGPAAGRTTARRVLAGAFRRRGRRPWPRRTVAGDAGTQARADAARLRTGRRTAPRPRRSRATRSRVEGRTRSQRRRSRPPPRAT